MTSTAEQTTPKKKLLRIKALPGTKPMSSGYSELPKSSIMFSVAGQTEEGDRAQCVVWSYCREALIRDVAHNIKRTKSGDKKSVTERVDPNRLRLLVLFGNTPEFKEKLFSGKRALNLFERAAGWEGRSVITTVNHEAYEKNVWLITGPKEWMLYPQMLSLGTWIMRMAAGYGPLNTASLSALEKQFKNLYETKGTGNSDLRYAKSFWDKAYVLAKYCKDVFAKVDSEYTWVAGGEGEVGVSGGIMTLISDTENNEYCKSVVKPAYKNFMELCKAHLPRKPEATEKP